MKKTKKIQNTQKTENKTKPKKNIILDFLRYNITNSVFTNDTTIATLLIVTYELAPYSTLLVKKTCFLYDTRTNERQEDRPHY